MKAEIRGSYTVEAALILPLIFTAFAAVLVLGMRQAETVSTEIAAFQEERRQQGQINFSERVRLGQAAADLFGEE